VIFRKTKMCKFNMVGRCTRGDVCKFAHSESELEPLPDFHFTRMCPAFVETGHCHRGAACTFAHKVSELRAPTKGAAQNARGPSPQEELNPQQQPPQLHSLQLLQLQQSQLQQQHPLPQPQLQQTLISTQGILAGMGVVLLQVLPQTAIIESDGVRERGVAGLHSVEEPSDEDDGDVSELDFDDCDSPLKCGNPSGGWSRQTTEEGLEVEEPFGEFSRQSSEESTWGVEELLAKQGAVEELLAEQGKAEEVARPEGAQLGVALRASGLAFAVKNTFLQFDDREGPVPVLRRVSSTGSCAIRGA